MGSAVRNYALVTASYWGFTLTDGALPEGRFVRAGTGDRQHQG